jgi:hypothetical protein
MLARSPNRKADAAYLAASGAVPIIIIECDGVCSIRATWWTAAPDAARIANAAR